MILDGLALMFDLLVVWDVAHPLYGSVARLLYGSVASWRNLACALNGEILPSGAFLVHGSLGHVETSNRPHKRF